MSDFVFDTSTFDPSSLNTYEALPTGEYSFEIEGTENYTKENGDKLIKITLVCIDEKYSGRRVWDYCKYFSASGGSLAGGPQRVMSALLAAGIPGSPSPDEACAALDGETVNAKVKLRKAKPGDSYGDSNNVVEYKPYTKPTSNSPTSW